MCVPPVCSGVRPKKKKKKKMGAGRGGHGHAPGLKVLVPAGKDDPQINLYRVFAVVIHAHYCKNLNPPVPAGSTGADAVMWKINQPRVKRELLKSVGSMS